MKRTRLKYVKIVVIRSKATAELKAATNIFKDPMPNVRVYDLSEMGG